jgi:FkbM family methyltransferase
MTQESILAVKLSKLNPARMILLFYLKFMHLFYRALPYVAFRYGKFTLRLPLCLFDKRIRCSLFFRPFVWCDVYTIYEQYVVDQYERLREIMPSDVVVDVGAYIGDFTVKACSKAGRKGRVIAFEPSSEEYNLLTRNIDVNLIKNCSLYNVACGDSAANKTLYWSTSAQHNPGSKSLVNGPKIAKSVLSVISIQKLDDVCKNAGITHVNFLKVDAEGYALEVLKGAEGLLRNGTYIAMELHLPSEREVNTYLSKLGYKQVVRLNSPWGGILYAFRTGSRNQKAEVSGYVAH